MKVRNFAALPFLLLFTILVSCEKDDPTLRNWSAIDVATLQSTVGKSLNTIESEILNLGFELSSAAPQTENITERAFRYTRNYKDAYQDYESLTFIASSKDAAITSTMYWANHNNVMNRQLLEKYLGDFNVSTNGQIAQDSTASYIELKDKESVSSTYETSSAWTSFDEAYKSILDVYDEYAGYYDEAKYSVPESYLDSACAPKYMERPFNVYLQAVDNSMSIMYFRGYKFDLGVDSIDCEYYKHDTLSYAISDIYEKFDQGMVGTDRYYPQPDKNGNALYIVYEYEERQKVDEKGDSVFDTQGNPVMETVRTPVYEEKQKEDENGKPMVDENNKPIMETVQKTEKNKIGEDTTKINLGVRYKSIEYIRDTTINQQQEYRTEFELGKDKVKARYDKYRYADIIRITISK